jgi:uncharacterized FlgJ-related protein
MFYKFNKHTLQYEKVNWVQRLLNFITVGVILFVIVITNIGLNTKQPITQVTEQELIIINRNHDKFTPEKLEEEIKRLNFRFPHIVYAQSILETGTWTSPIFKENHNLFGMKEARIRTNLAEGTHRSHAYYNNWRESVYDYALYYATYLHSIRTEDDYFDYLDASYAEATNYVGALKKIIEEEELKEKFGS